MVQDRGLNAVSFQDLADAVGLRKPSVFHHFRNKEELTLRPNETQLAPTMSLTFC